MKQFLFSMVLRIASMWFFVLSNLVKAARSILPVRSRNYVVVLANDGMGDNLYRMPLFAALRQKFPPDVWKIVVFCLPSLASLFRRTPFFDEVRTAKLYSHKMLFWPFSGYVRWSLLHHARIWINLVRIRTTGYDFAQMLAAPDWSVSYDTTLLAKHLPKEAEFQRKKNDRRYSMLLSSTISKNLIEDYKTILSGLDGVGCKARLEPTNVSFLVDRCFDPRISDHRYAVFVPGAAGAHRRWPVERFREVAAALLERYSDLSVVIVGTAAESELGDVIRSINTDRVINLCGRTDFPQLGRVLAGAECVLSNETGTAHYAAALGVKTICILGGGDYGTYFPMPKRSNVTCVSCNESCFKCGWFCTKQKTSVLAPCIDAVSVQDVLSAIK